MKIQWSRLLILLSMPLIIGPIVNYFHPLGLPLFHSKQGLLFNIDSDLEMLSYERAVQIQKLRRDIFVDVRSEKAYNKMHIPGAVSVPAKDFEGKIDQFLASYPMETPIVVYCQSKRCSKSIKIGERFRDEGYHHVRIYLGGMREWSGKKKL